MHADATAAAAAAAAALGHGVDGLELQVSGRVDTYTQLLPTPAYPDEAHLSLISPSPTQTQTHTTLPCPTPKPHA